MSTQTTGLEQMMLILKLVPSALPSSELTLEAQNLQRIIAEWIPGRAEMSEGERRIYVAALKEAIGRSGDIEFIRKAAGNFEKLFTSRGDTLQIAWGFYHEALKSGNEHQERCFGTFLQFLSGEAISKTTQVDYVGQWPKA